MNLEDAENLKRLVKTLTLVRDRVRSVAIRYNTDFCCCTVRLAKSPQDVYKLHNAWYNCVMKQRFVADNTSLGKGIYNVTANRSLQQVLYGG